MRVHERKGVGKYHLVFGVWVDVFANVAHCFLVGSFDNSYFKKLRILDGGMGQELHAKGLISKGTLWMTSAVLNEKYHNLIVDTHLNYINAGAEVITTTTFSSRLIRMEQNKVDHLFEFANKKACELALKAKDISNKEIFTAAILFVLSILFINRESFFIYFNF